MKIICPIYKTSKSHPNLTALMDNDQILTYKQLNELVEKYSNKFKSLDIQPDTRVGIFSRNSIEYVISIFTLLRLGVPFVPLNLRWSDAALKDSIGQANCFSVLTGFKKDVFHKMEIKIYSLGELDFLKSINKDNSKILKTEIPTDSEMAVFFTSGSSGNPKGAILTVGNLYYSAIGSNQYISLDKEDCWLASLPFYHVGGLAILFRCFLATASVFVLPDFSQQRLLFALRNQRITHISLIPSMLENLIDSGNIDCLTKLKCILLGGAPIGEKLLRKVRKCSLPVFTTYGMTETASQVTCLNLEGCSKNLSISGKCLPFREISILNEKGDRLLQNREGEIAIRGKVLFRGYLKDDRKYNSKSWFKTGDIGYLDREDNLVVKGRKDELIISGGENIYPAEIENVVKKYPGITECCVVSVPNSKWGQRPVLFVEVEDLPSFEKKNFFCF